MSSQRLRRSGRWLRFYLGYVVQWRRLLEVPVQRALMLILIGLLLAGATPAHAKWDIFHRQQDDGASSGLAQFTRDTGQAPMPILHTAGKRKIKTHANAFEGSRWNPFSRRNRQLKRLQAATTKGGYASMNTPFQNGAWAPKLPPVHKTVMHKLFYREGRHVKPVAAKSNRRWHLL